MRVHSSNGRLGGVVAVCLIAAAGCDRDGRLVGSVRYNGQTLAFGTVQVRGADGLVRAAPIGPDGRFTVAGLPAGPARIAVTCRDPREVEYNLARARGGRDHRGGSGAAKPPGPAPDFSVVPPRYSDLDRADLSTTVAGGVNAFDIDLR